MLSGTASFLLQFVLSVTLFLFGHSKCSLFSRLVLPFVCLTVGFVAGFARYRESSFREPAFSSFGRCTLHGPMVGLHMVSALASSHTSWPDGGLHMLSALAVLP